jgi:hypothetical protein
MFHGVKDGEKYQYLEDVLSAYERACCWRCVQTLRRNSTWNPPLFRLLQKMRQK